MKKFIHLFIYLATLITLISCGDGIDSLNQNKIKTIKVDEDIVSQSFGLSVYEGIDQRDNKIRVYAIPDFIEDVVVEENVNYGTPPSFDIITNNFIRVRFPSEISEYHQTIRVLPRNRLILIKNYIMKTGPIFLLIAGITLIVFPDIIAYLLGGFLVML